MPATNGTVLVRARAADELAELREEQARILRQTRAPIVAATLRQAREESGFTVDDMAKKLQINPEKFAAFESGEDRPTARQLEKIASILGWPSVMFLAQPVAVDSFRPEGHNQLVDFRGADAEPLDPDYRKEVRRALERRHEVVHMGLAEGLPEWDFSWDLTQETPQAAAERFRSWLGIGDTAAEWRPKTTADTQVYSFWADALSARGALIFQVSRIPLSQFRGLSVLVQPLPVIVLNGADSVRARVFSLLHEVGHLALRRGGVCSISTVEENFDPIPSDTHAVPLTAPAAINATRIEPLVNAFAGYILIPESRLLPFIEGTGAAGEELVAQASSYFRVSRAVSAIRLHSIGAVDMDTVHKILTVSQRPRKHSTGGPSQRVMVQRNLGSLFIDLVEKGMSDGVIDILDAAHMMGTTIHTAEAVLRGVYP